MTKQELGLYGENLAKNYLIEKGYAFLAANFRFRHLELDLIFMDEEKLVVVEVKTRQTAEIGEPWRAVTRSKQRQIIKAADAYILQEDFNGHTRFDIVSIVHNGFRTEIEHIEDAFGAV